MKRILSCALMVLSIVAVSGKAFSHFMWINVDPYFARPGQKVLVEVCWGHRFPRESTVREGMLDTVYVVGPSGKSLRLNRLDRAHFFFVPRTDGVYTVFARLKSGFLTKTVRGIKFQPKKGLKGVVKCFHFDRSAKAIVVVGRGGKLPDFSKFPSPINTVFASNSCRIRVGDEIKLKVTLNGAPAPYAYVYATYAGFSSDPNTYCYATMTGSDGTCKVKVLKKGVWLIKSFYRKPYPEPSVCDEYNFVDTITFRVK